MDIIRINKESADDLASLVADFRVTLRTYKGIKSEPDIAGAKEELHDLIMAGYPIFAAKDDGKNVGYIVCRIEDAIVWVEHIYVCESHRRKGVASALFQKAEEVSRSLGGDTVFNYVHPNNDGMIRFLRTKGYTVLNLIEIRKPYKGEILNTTINVDNNVFDY